MNKKLIFISIFLVGILVLPTFSLGQTQNTTFSQIDCSQYTSQQEKLMCTYFNLLFQLYTLLIQQLQSRIGIQPGQPVQLVEPTLLPTTCVDREGEAPVITSIYPTSGPVGTKVEIRGCNLAGFEGDLDVVFVRSDGKEIPLYGGNWHPGYGGETRRGKIIIVTVESYCPDGHIFGRYSGIVSPCETVEATPGVYKVYANPFGKRSNPATFTITPSQPVQQNRPITVLSPNGGEKLEIGKTYEIKWYQQTSGDFSMHLERKRVFPECSSNFCHFTGWAPFEHIDSIIGGRYDAGFHTVKWIIPDYIKPGNDYAICVSINSEYGERDDCSDAPFSIVK
jgi:hypothetical protein